MLGVLGDLVEDIVVWMHEPVQHASDTQVRIFKTRGGSGANVAAFAATRFPTRFFGCVGHDATGDAVVADLRSAGVDVREQRRGTTGTIVLLVDDTGERTMLPQRGASTLLEALSDDDLDGLELLHVPAYSFDGDDLRAQTLLTLRRARERGVLLSVDASSSAILRKFGTSSFLRLIANLRPAFLIANADEAQVLTGGTGSPRDLLRLIPETAIVVKAGSGATTVYRQGHDDLVVPVPPVADVKDSTGAGDAFAAGFLTTFLQTGALRESCVEGHALAAHVLQTAGAQMGNSYPEPFDTKENA